MLQEAKDAPFMRKTRAALKAAFEQMAQDIINSGETPIEDISIKINFPRSLYYFMGNRGWFSVAKKKWPEEKGSIPEALSNNPGFVINHMPPEYRINKFA